MPAPPYKPAVLIEDLGWMAQHGVGLSEAANRLGYTRGALYQALLRMRREGYHGVDQLLNRLLAQDWLGMRHPGSASRVA
jgi:hypothetical protein